MDEFNRRSVALSSPERRQFRFADLRERITRTFAGVEQPTESHDALPLPTDGWEDPVPPMPWEESSPRFPTARRGYECAAVDQHIAELEQELMALDQELAQLRVQVPSPGEVTSEIQRVGEQTSAILIAAHEQAQQTARHAEQEAERRMTEATSNAFAITAQARQQVGELEREKGALQGERERLIKDIRTISSALAAVADEADQRFTPAGSPAADD